MPQRGPRGVRDVPAEQFIRAYAEHLKANDKVRAVFGLQGIACLNLGLKATLSPCAVAWSRDFRLWGSSCRTTSSLQAYSQTGDVPA